MKCTLLIAIAFPFAAVAQSSCTALRPKGSIRPSVASGWELQVVATGLSRPRGLAFDSQGHLLVVQAGAGVISAHTLNDNGGCVTVGSSKNVTSRLSLNHGIQISSDGATLYASNVENVFSWAYNAADMSATNQATLIQGMNGTDHSTRTLQLIQKAPGNTIVVSRGSSENLDFEAASLSSGHSQVKAFDLSQRGNRVYDFEADGKRLGWGLRNSVGVAEHPLTGGIWTVENSADNIMRGGRQVNQNNPAEELNYHGTLNGTQYSNATQDGNYGYPWCFAVWAPEELPDSGNLAVGKQFALSQSSDLNNQNRTDAYCAQQVAPRLSFQAHMAPLDIKFNNSGAQAWIPFHGSWNRDTPVGYKVSIVTFANGEPTVAANTKPTLIDVVKNQDDTACPDNCLRPVAVAIDSKGRVFFSSDASGEIYLITRTSSNVTGNSGSTATTTSANSGFLRSEPGYLTYAILNLLAFFIV